MRKNYEYLKDKEFLKYIDEQIIQEQYAKITVLDWQERPIQDIQGIVTTGTETLNNNSNIRRTSTLTVYVHEDSYSGVTNIDNLISLNKKIRLEIGIKNMTDKYSEYDILWFPQGVFVMISPSITHSTSGTTISLQLKDKMCLLNGECGGVIPASTRFDEYETLDENGDWVVERPVIAQIIRECVNHFGGEQLSKIIISDLDDRVKQVMKWTGNSPIYLVNDNGNYTMESNYSKVAGKSFTMYSYGEDIGFVYTDFTYPGELVGDENSNVCTILDKIKDTLGNYEYFYDIDGNFVFQEIKNYLNTSQSTLEIDKINNNDYLIDRSKGKAVYKFDNSNIITSFTNNPQYNMIKNDFIVWGIKENSEGLKIPIRYHLAIDKKPEIGNTYQCFFYEDPDDNLVKAKRPIEYDSFADIKKTDGAAGVFYLAKDTGNIYYWGYNNKTEKYEYILYDGRMTSITTEDWRTELYLQGVQAEPLGIESNYYYTELLNEWPKLYDVKAGAFIPEIVKTPSNADFFLDFIDSDAEISQFSISNIGRRSIVESSEDINCVFESDIPDFVLIEKGQSDTEEKRNECIDRGQKYIQVDSTIFKLLAAGGALNSAYFRVRELLYQYTSYNESITIQAKPIYYLEPNIRIEVQDKESDIYGDYMISTISIPLGTNGTMSISATRALERI